jgi:FlgD Ig-like domain
MFKKFLILSWLFVIFVFCSLPSFAASIIKTSESDFTASGTSFESTTATVETGNILVEIEESKTLFTTNGVSFAALSDYQEGARMVPDGSGGAIITWQDGRTAGSYNIYAQRIDSNGNKLWGESDVIVCDADQAQTNARLALDGSGGVIIAWLDRRSTTQYDLYAQKLSINDGQSQWADNGKPISIQANDHRSPQIVADGAGGAIIVWEYFEGASNYDIYAHRVNPDGTTNSSWPASGKVICNASNVQSYPQIVSDGNEGAIITWDDIRNGTDYNIYVQRINGDATFPTGWTTANGKSICSVSGDQQFPQLVSDGNQGAIITWSDKRSGVLNRDVYAQRVDGSGAIQWTPSGELVCDAINNQSFPKIVSDGSNGVIIIWHDDRGTSSDIYAQRLNSDGDEQWAPNGKVVCDASLAQNYVSAASDKNGGALIAWLDDRGAGTDNNIYAQRIDANGDPKWTVNGVEICAADGPQANPRVIDDNRNGAIIIWDDERDVATLDIDLYLQRVNLVYYPSGAYTTEKIQNTDTDFLGWTTLGWTASGNLNTEVRTAITSAGLDTASWTSVINGADVPNHDNGNYPWLQIRTHFTPADLNTSTPSLQDLSINYNNDTAGTTLSLISGPSPFNPEIESTNISFNLTQPTNTSLYIFTLAGELIYKQTVSTHAGINSTTWNGRNVSGTIVPNGVYYYQLVANNKSIGSGNIIVLK